MEEIKDDHNTLQLNKRDTEILSIIEAFINQILSSLYTTHHLPKLQTQSHDKRGRTPRVKVDSERYFKVIIIVTVIYHLIKKQKEITTRELYYTYKTIFKTQQEVEQIIKTILLLFGLLKEETRIISTPKGFMYGDIELFTMKYSINFNVSHQIPVINEECVISKTSERTFFIIVEKEAFYSHLIQSRITKMLHCIILCSRGFPDNATLNVVKCISSRQEIVPCCFVDCDIYGIEIFLSFLCNGSWRRYESNNDPIHNLQWSLFRPTELQKLIQQCSIPVQELSKREICIANHLLASKLIQANSELKSELQTILSLKKKMEIDQIIQFDNWEIKVISSILKNNTQFSL